MAQKRYRIDEYALKFFHNTNIMGDSIPLKEIAGIVRTRFGVPLPLEDILKEYNKWAKDLTIIDKIKIEGDFWWKVTKNIITFGLAFDGIPFMYVKRRWRKWRKH